MGFIRMKGADRGCSNLGEEITLNEIEGMSLKHFIPKKKKNTTLEEYLVYSKWDSHFEKL